MTYVPAPSMSTRLLLPLVTQDCAAKKPMDRASHSLATCKDSITRFGEQAWGTAGVQSILSGCTRAAACGQGRKRVILVAGALRRLCCITPKWQPSHVLPTCHSRALPCLSATPCPKQRMLPWQHQCWDPCLLGTCSCSARSGRQCKKSLSRIKSGQGCRKSSPTSAKKQACKSGRD